MSGGCLQQGWLQGQEGEEGIYPPEPGPAPAGLEGSPKVGCFLGVRLAAEQPLQSPPPSGAYFPLCYPQAPSGCTWLYAPFTIYLVCLCSGSVAGSHGRFRCSSPSTADRAGATTQSGAPPGAYLLPPARAAEFEYTEPTAPLSFPSPFPPSSAHRHPMAFPCLCSSKPAICCFHIRPYTP